MVFPKRKSAAKKSSPQKTERQAAPASTRQKSFGSFFQRKKVEEAVVEPEAIALSLTRSLRSANMPSKAQEDAISDSKKVRGALVAIEAILYAMDQAREAILQCHEIVESASHTDDLGGRALLAEKYDEARVMLDQVAAETESPGKELISIPGQSHDLELSGRARYSIAGFCVGTEEHALNLPPPLTAFADDDEIEHTKLALDAAATRVSRATASYCRDAKVLMTRIAELTNKLERMGVDQDMTAAAPSPNLVAAQ